MGFLIALRPTVIKRKPIQSHLLEDNLKFSFLTSERLEYKWIKPASDHWLFELTNPVKGFFNWYGYMPHLEVEAEDRARHRRTNPAGRDLIKRFEGLRLEAYICPTGHWTIGYGHTPAHPGQRITKQEAEDLFDRDLIRFEKPLNEWIPSSATSNQFSACVSLAFNIGVAAFHRSSVLRWMKSGDYHRAADSFLLWNKGIIGGKFQALPGLTRRRLEERALFTRKELRP